MTTTIITIIIITPTIDEITLNADKITIKVIKIIRITTYINHVTIL
jgi:hypothetical protein